MEKYCNNSYSLPITYSDRISIESRFGKPGEFLKRAGEIAGREPICGIEEAEPIGPKGYLDLLAIIPCTGNTAAKLANGITDTGKPYQKYKRNR